MVELVDTYALGAYAARCAGSNPVPGTITAKHSMSVFLYLSFGPNGTSPVPGTRILAISAHLGFFQFHSMAYRASAEEIAQLNG